jgi:hypothetical protein
LVQTLVYLPTLSYILFTAVTISNARIIVDSKVCTTGILVDLRSPNGCIVFGRAGCSYH